MNNKLLSLCGPFPLVGLTLTWFIWDTKLALHITLYSVKSTEFAYASIVLMLASLVRTTLKA